MLSLEQKQAVLVEKWNNIRKKLSVEDIRSAVKSLKSAVPKADIDLSDRKIGETAFDHLARAIWEASGRDIKSMVPEGKKNQSWYLLNLKNVLEWHGNVAIGEDKYFDGWVNVVPPNGCTMCYFGPGALDRAREMAKKIMSYYP